MSLWGRTGPGCSFVSSVDGRNQLALVRGFLKHEEGETGGHTLTKVFFAEVEEE